MTELMLVQKKAPQLRALVIVAILLVSIICFDSAPNTHAASGASIPTEGGTWRNSTLTILIAPQPNAPWFKASYSFDVSRAISRWTESIIAYTDNYGSSYLRKLSFVTCVSGINDTLCGYPDIQVRFVQSFGSQSAGLGLTSVQIQTAGTFQATFQAPTITTFAAYDPTNRTQLTDTDMINISSHEFGHALGLGHATASATDDGTFELMFLSYGQAVGNSANSLEAPSTLDLSALSYVYDWLATSSTLTHAGHPAADLSLPSGTAYSSVYPYSEQLQTLQNSINRLKLEIIILAVVAAFLLALVLVLGILLLRKKTAPPQPFLGEPVAAPPSVQIVHRR